ncbi:MAG: HAMP domain-containing histidine kinase [Phycisphaerales bacterium]|nr:HAMP domain-containing histidine kinase [Phycisphaerales bacterium]
MNAWWSGALVGMALGAVVVWAATLAVARRQYRRVRAAERRARNAERLAEIGAMTGGLAHEIKNPLSTIGLNAELLSEGIRDSTLGEDEKRRLVARVGSLSREAERLRDILGDFLKFAGELRLDLREHDVNEVVEELIDFYRPQAEHVGVRLRAELGPGPMPAQLDADHLKQALLNLLLNATQAMTGTNVANPNATMELIVRTHAASGPEQGWAVHVIDTGPGIADDVRASIFRPYFTTKSGGSGLGLPTTKRIIEAHHGTIDVHTSPNAGTDFEIVLPRAGATSTS